MLILQNAEPPLFVHLTRIAGLLTLFGGILLLVAANAVVGVCAVLLSALCFALAQIIEYLAVIARKLSGCQFGRNGRSRKELRHHVTGHRGNDIELCQNAAAQSLIPHDPESSRKLQLLQFR